MISLAPSKCKRRMSPMKPSVIPVRRLDDYPPKAAEILMHDVSSSLDNNEIPLFLHRIVTHSLVV